MRSCLIRPIQKLCRLSCKDLAGDGKSLSDEMLRLLLLLIPACGRYGKLSAPYGSIYIRTVFVNEAAEPFVKCIFCNGDCGSMQSPCPLPAGFVHFSIAIDRSVVMI